MLYARSDSLIGMCWSTHPLFRTVQICYRRASHDETGCDWDRQTVSWCLAASGVNEPVSMVIL